MKLKDATRTFGSVGILLPLILIFLIAADAALACPGTQTRVVYRTRTVNSRTVPLMGTTVISYGGSARCGDSAYVTRPVRYVAVRRSSPRYVAVRSSDSYYPTRRVRYVAVRSNVDYDAQRYVAVRRQPVRVESRVKYVAVGNDYFADASRYVPVDSYDTNGRHVMRYAAVRSGYRTGNGIVGYVDVNDSPRYVAVRRQPVYVTGTRYVAVRNADSDYDDDDYIAPARYVAVRNVRNTCACADTLRSSLDEVETVSPRHVVVKSDYLAGTQEVITPEPSYDDTAYVAVPSDSVNRTYVGYSNAAYYDDSDTYIPASYAVIPRTRTISYVPTYDDSDLDDQAVLDTDDATYVADDDIGDACLSRVAVQAPMEYRTDAVNYVPVSYVDEDASLVGSGTTYIADDTASSDIDFVPVVDSDTMYIAADDVGDSCSCPVALRTFDSDVSADTVSYLPANYANGMDTRTINYEPAETIGYTPVHKINYVPADEMNVEPVSYVPADNVDYVDTADTAACTCPTSETSVVTQPAEAADASTVIVDDTDSDLTADMTDTQAIAGDNGYRDGLEDGKDAALNGMENRPENEENFRAGTNGYNDTFGEMAVYNDAYRSSYLQGFSAGYNSTIGP